MQEVPVTLNGGNPGGAMVSEANAAKHAQLVKQGLGLFVRMLTIEQAREALGLKETDDAWHGVPDRLVRVTIEEVGGMGDGTQRAARICRNVPGPEGAPFAIERLLEEFAP